ncbi:ATPase [Fimbriiglobus ruber]|uniref:ATPase n=1 Tax=Fimbriiglobus ruber TaxID=1908690 RepID=A0A225EB10_9BACT|nr:ATP-binding protein [Fimbriiglobus ruber]OWK46569.1 ATPase [Fimbriiglobus ruber]
MSRPIFVFDDGEDIGSVVAVDTSRVAIEVSDPEHASRLCVGNLLAIRGSTQHELLIGMVERLTRSAKDGVHLDHDEDNNEIGETTRFEDLIRAVLIGTYRTVHGDATNTFKRGADSFPQIGRECYLIDGHNLQMFMGLLAADIPVESQLRLGHFVNDPTALAIACGDKLFQRHAAILGSTGSGKSWAVALLLERAKQLKYPNIIVLDMHGEYSPLTQGEGNFAQGFRVAGPGDLRAPADGVLFLPYWLLNREEMLSMILDRSDQNAPNQASRFTAHVRALKGERLSAEGKNDVQNTFTVDSPIPYAINDLLNLLEKDDKQKSTGSGGREIKGEWEES